MPCFQFLFCLKKTKKTTPLAWNLIENSLYLSLFSCSPVPKIISSISGESGICGLQILLIRLPPPYFFLCIQYSTPGQKCKQTFCKQICAGDRIQRTLAYARGRAKIRESAAYFKKIAPLLKGRARVCFVKKPRPADAARSVTCTKSRWVPYRHTLCFQLPPWREACTCVPNFSSGSLIRNVG